MRKGVKKGASGWGPLAKKRADWKAKLRYKYDMSLQDLQDLKDKQNNCCAICNLPASQNYRGTLFIDHCHMTNQVRGLLCNDCNLAIGRMKDNPATLRAAAAYLERM